MSDHRRNPALRRGPASVVVPADTGVTLSCSPTSTGTRFAGARRSTPEANQRLSHLEALEAEAIHIIREVAASFRNPVMLYSVGKDSGVMLHLAWKAFAPGALPFPLLHVDTGYKFPEMYRFRDEFVARYGARLLTHRNDEAIAAGTHPARVGVARCCGRLKTEALLNALEHYGFDAAFGGARRDEEKSRAKERVFSFRDSFGQWDPRNQRPEIWSLYNGFVNEGESVRVFPLSNWTEADIWGYIQQEELPIVPLYYAAERDVIERDGVLLPAEAPGGRAEGDKVTRVSCRYRSLGCMPCTGAIRSEATTLSEIVDEALIAKRSERETRVIDHGANSMEDKKREGYF